MGQAAYTGVTDLEEMLGDLRELLKIPSVTDSPDVGTALETALAQCRRLGFRTKQYGSFLGFAEIGMGDELIGILAHLDVVPADGDWSCPPFDLTLKEGKAYGRGVLDDKGGAVCAMYAMRDILRDGKPLQKRIRLIFGTHEEEGAWDDMEFYKAHEELPICGFTPDGGFPAAYAEKGLARFNILVTDPALLCEFRELRGGEQINIVPDHVTCLLADGTVWEAAGKAAHASEPEQGVNAITELMQVLRKNGKAQAFADWYLSHFSQTDGSGLDIDFSSASGGSTTINVGKIGLDNGCITLELDVRFCADRCFDDVERQLKTALERPGIQVERRLFAEPVFLAPEGAIIRAMEESYQSVTGDNTRRAMLAPASTYASAMPNIAAFGPLFPDRVNTAHKVDEAVPVEDLMTARKIYYEALRKMLAIGAI